jgi:hypothetical protein
MARIMGREGVEYMTMSLCWPYYFSRTGRGPYLVLMFEYLL